MDEGVHSVIGDKNKRNSAYEILKIIQIVSCFIGYNVPVVKHSQKLDQQ